MYRLSAFALLLAPTAAMAHDGHGFYPADWLAHYLTAPEHAWAWISVAVLALAIVFRAQLRKHRAGVRQNKQDQ